MAVQPADRARVLIQTVAAKDLASIRMYAVSQLADHQECFLDLHACYLPGAMLMLRVVVPHFCDE